jgi:hypothetical protein
LGIYGQPFGKPVKKPYLQHRIGVVFRHRTIDHQLNNCMKTLREMMDLIESAQTPVAEGYTPTAGELARDLIKMPDSDFNKKYGMSKQQANRYYSSNKLKDPGMDEAQKTDNRPASQFDREIVKAQPDGSCELKCGHKTSAKLSKNPVGKKIFCARCYELRNKEQGVAEGMDDDVEHLANVAADAYWSGNFGMTSATEKVKMARDIVQAVEDGRLSIEELRQDIRDLDNKGVAEGSTVAYEVEWIDKNTGEQGLTTVSALTSQDAADKLVKMKLQQLDNVDVTDVFPAHKQTTDKEQSVDEDQATAQMGLMSAMGSNDNNPADQRRVMAQRAVEQLAAKR